MILKRIKGGMVHFATAVAPAGNVVGLSEKQAEAVELTVEQCEKARLFYAGREHAGEFAALNVTGRTPPPPPASKDM